MEKDNTPSNTLKNNAFNWLEIKIAFNLNIIQINERFQSEIKKQGITEDEKLSITKSYSILKDELTRGEEILKAFQISQESVEIPDGFFEDIMELDEEALTELSDEIHRLLSECKISGETIEKFAKHFMMYKYIKKAFLQ